MRDGKLKNEFFLRHPTIYFIKKNRNSTRLYMNTCINAFCRMIQPVNPVYLYISGALKFQLHPNFRVRLELCPVALAFYSEFEFLRSQYMRVCPFNQQ